MSQYIGDIDIIGIVSYRRFTCLFFDMSISIDGK